MRTTSFSGVEPHENAAAWSEEVQLSSRSFPWGRRTCWQATVDRPQAFSEMEHQESLLSALESELEEMERDPRRWKTHPWWEPF